MSKQQRLLFEETLRFAWEPELRRAGFEGDEWTYRRPGTHFTHAIGLEYDRRGKGLRLWLGATPVGFGGVPGDLPLSFHETKTENCLFRQHVGGRSGWLDYRSESTEAGMEVFVEYVIDCYDDQASDFFSRYEDLSRFEAATPDEIAKGSEIVRQFVNPRAAAMFLCSMNEFHSRPDLAWQFASVGLKDKDSGTHGREILERTLERLSHFAPENPYPRPGLSTVAAGLLRELGEHRFSRFVETLHGKCATTGRLKFWQREVWDAYRERNAIRDYTIQEMLELFPDS